MTDQQREALERLRGFNFAACGTDHCSDATYDDIEEVVKLAMSEHPPDDDERVTEEVLVRLGWEIQSLTPSTQCWSSCRALFVDEENKHTIGVDVTIDGHVDVGMHDRFGMYQCSLISGEVTTGQLRRLVAALKGE